MNKSWALFIIVLMECEIGGIRGTPVMQIAHSVKEENKNELDFLLRDNNNNVFVIFQLQGVVQ